MEDTKIVERPKRYDERIVSETHKLIADIIKEWSMQNLDDQEAMDYAKRIKWHQFDDNGFELAREFEYLSPDARLVDELDGVSYSFGDIMDKYTREWVKENSIVCPLKVGDLAVINTGFFKGTTCEVKRIYEDVARYGVWHEKMKCPRDGGTVQIHNFEDLMPPPHKSIKAE